MNPFHETSRGGKRKSIDRKINRFEKSPKFLIVCEGERTEPNYFKAFRPTGMVKEIEIYGEGYNTLSLVRKTIELADGIDYDQIWCVFDRDSFPPETFNAAVELARQHGFHVAYSNEAFELWYLLHYHYYNTGITRQSYCEQLDRLLGHEYKKNDKGIYNQLFSHQSDAIRNAKNLMREYEPCNPVRDNPSTTVFQLVEELNRYLLENRY
jgi:hypothetical protein